MKFLNVTVPGSFTSESNECITEATGWSQCRAVHLHPSIRLSSPPCWSSPHIRYPPQNIECSDMVTGFGIRDRKSVSYYTWKRIRNLLQRWTVSFYISARLSDVTLEAAEKDRTWRHCIEISMQRGLSVSVLRTHLYKVFTMMSSI